MVSLSNNAGSYLKRALVGVEKPENACFRLSLGLKGPELALDQVQPGDHEVEFDGDVVLTVEPRLEDTIGEQTLDYDTEKERLVLVEAAGS